MGRDLVLTFDVGTTAIKTVVWDAAVVPLAVHRQEYALATDGHRIEADPRLYVDGLVAGAHSVLDGIDAGRVAAVCLTTQGETLVPVDRRGEPLGPAIVWLDSRAGREADLLRTQLPGEAFHLRTGLPGLDATVPLAKAMHLRASHPDVPGGPLLLLLEDFLVHWLTGRLVGNRSLHTSTGWLEITTGGYWTKALDAAGLTTANLPELVDSGEPLGRLLPAAAEALGLDTSVQVVAGAMDQAAGALGAGLSEPGIAGVSFGTALVVTAPVEPGFRDPARRVTVYRPAVAGPSLAVLFEPTSGALLRWLRDLLSADGRSTLGYARLDALAGAVPPGSDGVVALPSFEGGADGGGRGAFLGLGLHSGRGHLARSLLEATAFALADLLDSLAAQGVPVTGLRSSGGGSASRLWQSIAADACGLPVTPLPFAEAASAGAALLACWGAGLLRYGEDPRGLPEITPILPAGDGRYLAPLARYRAARTALEPFWG